MIHYSIGHIDTRFAISESQMRSSLQQAESVWETGAGKNLFDYDANAKLKINLVYDERQYVAVHSKIMEFQLKKLQKSHRLLIEKYRRLLALYGEKKREYLLHPGEDKRVKLNGLAHEVNAVGAEINHIAETYNQGVATYRERFGASRQFVEGEYDGREINVYQFYDTSDLTLVLAHEMGHALGIRHVQNPRSIMYMLMGQQDLRHLQLSREDLAALEEKLRSERVR